jgi:NAD(P)-dependent dehydrogenase (short-subunit alcohol dehydrogenase family)
VQLAESVVVVTGASSGIGRATAVRLAGQGARVALLARRAAELDGLVAQLGPERALAVPVDVTDADAVVAAADRVRERFGRIDGWVNNAAVTMFGGLLDTPLADVRRVLDVNLMGCVHGARAALPAMVEQGGGVLVNVSSILGVIAQPYGSAYTMSKFAIRGLSVSLREELRLLGARGVRVSTVLPAAIDTPIYAAAANHTGREIHPPPPVYTAERVAAVIVGQLRRPRREVVAGGLLGRAFVLQHAVAPRLTERLLADEFEHSLRGGGVPATSGALHAPDGAPARVDGGWRGAQRERRRRTGALVAAGLGTLALVGRRARR